MKFILSKTSNYWQTLSRKVRVPRSRRILWLVIKMVLVVLHLVCKLIDLSVGTRIDS